MTRIAHELRVRVRERAAQRCEYCRLPDRLHIGGFEVDHIIPLSRGGQTLWDNLAYACPHCNDRKWAHVDSPDPVTGDVVPLFDPRNDRWHDHFDWSADPTCEVHGKTPTGRATVACLQLNHPELVAIRRELVKLGISVASHGND
jgi:hypothetical protein